MFSQHDTVESGGRTLYVLTDNTTDCGWETLTIPQKRNSKKPDYSNPIWNLCKRYDTESEAISGHSNIIAMIDRPA